MLCACFCYNGSNLYLKNNLNCTFIMISSLEGDYPKKRKLMCAKCKKTLNTSKIYYIVNVGNICEQCVTSIKRKKKNTNTICHELTLEEARVVKNPCKNYQQGCNILIGLGDTLNHEDFCDFQVLTCRKCQWSGAKKLLDEHISSTHQTDFINPPQLRISEIKQKKNLIYFTNIHGIPATILVRYCNNTFYCIVLLNDLRNSQCFKYQVEFEDVEGNNSIVFRKDSLGSLLETGKSWYSWETVLSVDMDYVKTFLKNCNNIRCTFGIARKNKKELKSCPLAKERLKEILSCDKNNKKNVS